MNENASVSSLLQFIRQAPTSFHGVAAVSEMLLREGYCRLQESMPWSLTPGGKYFVTRNQSSVIAFAVPQGDFQSFQIIASHCDSPCFKVKELPEISSSAYVQLNTERYGGMLFATWADRPLSVAGRVTVLEDGVVRSRLVNLDRDLVMIPNLAIHMGREANTSYNPQADLMPLFGDGSAKERFLPLIAEACGVQPEQILGHDLFLYNRMEGTVWGADNEFFSAPRLDDLACVYASVRALLESRDQGAVRLCCVFDNEEVGSSSKQGAASSFLKDVLGRICLGFGKSGEQLHTMLSGSFMLSADNGHALHPNHPAIADPVNRPQMNKGVVVKYNANQKYTTDGVSSALFRQICKGAGVPCQSYANRSDQAGGSTLGNIANQQVSVNTVDIGMAQLAMHSSYETAGVKDLDYMIQAMTAFYSSRIVALEDGGYRVEPEIAVASANEQACGEEK